MKKVTFFTLNAKYAHSSLSVWVLAEGVRRFASGSYDLSVAQATINEPTARIVDSVLALKPDFLCVSTYIWSAKILPGVLSELRKHLPGTIFILGGPEAVFNAGFWLDGLADYVLAGEGEFVLPEFLDRLSGFDLHGENSPTKPPVYSDTFIDPYTAEYFAALSGRLAYIETSRGCPFSCAFCLSSSQSVRLFPLDSVKGQIRKLAASDTKTIKFVDRTFNCNAERAYEILEFCLSLESTPKFHFEVAADLFDERTLNLLETAPPGRFQFEIGLQSFYEPALLASSRKTDLNRAVENIKRLTQSMGNNIHIHVDLIAGLPYESLYEFENSFNRAFELCAHHLQLGFLKLLHGSDLRNLADELGLIYADEAPYEILSSPWLSEDDIRVLKDAENALQHTYNKGRFLSVISYVLEVSGLSPFALFRALGRTYPNHGTGLELYATQVFSFCIKLDGVDKNDLTDKFLFDWLSMVKGKNAPEFLKARLLPPREFIEWFNKNMGRKLRRGEAGFYGDGLIVYVDSEKRSSVTDLYDVFYWEHR